MTGKEAVQTIGQSTPITIGVMIALISVAFFAGVLWNKVDANNLADSKREAILLELKKSNDASRQQISQNRYRIEIIERKLP